MAIGMLYVVPTDQDTLAGWSFANAVHHIDISRVIFEQTQTRIDEYILDPFNPDDIGKWAYWHQVTHNAQNQVLGIQGQDLTGVNFQDPDALATWIYTHANEHLQAATILGLG